MGGSFLDFCAGALAGASADMCLFPLDTIRARSMSGVQRGLVDEARHLVRTEGAIALYKGLPPHLLASVPSNGVFYATYEAARSAIGPHLGSPAAASACAAAAACVTSIAIYTPAEVVKQRAMVTRGATSISVLGALLRAEGPAGLYRGLGAAALTWAPYLSLYFFAYETLTTRALGLPPGQEPPFLAALTCGLAAGVSAAVLTNPFDVVKTRIQVGAGAMSGWRVAREIAAAEGARGFARGVVPRALLLAPASSLTIAFYSAFERAGRRLFADGREPRS